MRTPQVSLKKEGKKKKSESDTIERRNAVKVQSEGLRCWAKRLRHVVSGKAGGTVVRYDEARLDVEC